jgi:hypothetical protein
MTNQHASLWAACASSHEVRRAHADLAIPSAAVNVGTLVLHRDVNVL